MHFVYHFCSSPMINFLLVIAHYSTFISYAEGTPLLWLDPKKGVKKSQDLELRSLQNRGLTRKKVKLGSASNNTFFLLDSHDFAVGYSTMVFPLAAVSRRKTEGTPQLVCPHEFFNTRTRPPTDLLSGHLLCNTPKSNLLFLDVDTFEYI